MHTHTHTDRGTEALRLRDILSETEAKRQRGTEVQRHRD